MVEFRPEDFRTSSFTGEHPTKQCVEVALLAGVPVVAVGDTKAPRGTYLVVSREAFAGLLTIVP